MSQPATAGTNTHYVSIPPSPNAAFQVDTVAGYQGIHRSASFNPIADSTGAANSAQTAGGAQAVSVVNQYFAMSNPS